MARYEEELICDLAETYGIYDYQALSPALVATLVVGLRDDSRVKMSISGTKVGSVIHMMAYILDSINHLAWMQSRDGAKGRKHPKSVAEKLARVEENTNIKTFTSLDDFKAAWNGD